MEAMTLEQAMPMDTAPRDGTMLRLLVRFTEHATDDAEEAWTIGSNSFDANGEDVWQFAGWCWMHDHFTEGKGTPIGWLPMLANLAQPAQAVDVGADFGAMNRALCDFAMRWEIDGDYMRCLKCKRPQITNYASHDFPHAHGCKAAGNVEARPWETFAQLLSPLTRAISVQKAGPVGDGWKVLQIGAVGCAYDPPNTYRAFTYDHQPGNGLAWSLGQAALTAAGATAGDNIDRGLSLLKALEAQGFGVFQLPASPTPDKEGK